MNGSDLAYAVGLQMLAVVVVVFVAGVALGIGLWEGIPWLYHHISINLH